MVARLDERYRRGEKLGSGGMSQVFKAWDTRLKRDVAIKILHDHLAEKEESRRRFSREAEAVAKLHHPNILEIFDFSTEDGRESFIVTEYIKGRTLRDFGEEFRFHPPEIAAMATFELACALEHAHAKGVIHRDLKPENVMIRDDGVLKLMDFGIAKVLDEGDRMTMTGALVGSPAHMAPEIIEGQVATAAADIFSLGTILYWLCCHKLPFVGNNPTQTLKLILDATYPDPREVNAAVSDELAAIVAKCLSREPADRYPTAQQLREALGSELARNGLEDPAKECAQFFREPAAYADRLKASLITRLLAEAQATAHGPTRNYARTIKLADRVLALDTNNAQALALMSATRLSQRRRRMWASAGKGALALVGLAALSFAGVLGLNSIREHRAVPLDKPDLSGKPVGPQPNPLPPPVVDGKSPDQPKPPVVVATDPAKPPGPEPIVEPRPGHPKVEPPRLVGDKDGKKPKPPDVALVVAKDPAKPAIVPPTPTPVPPKPVKKDFTIQPPLMTAKVRLDGAADARRVTSSFTELLSPGEHRIRVECDKLCEPKEKSFTVLDLEAQPAEVIQLRYRATLEMAADEGVQQVFVDDKPMPRSADSKKFTLEYLYQPDPVNPGDTTRTVKVQVIRDGLALPVRNVEVKAGATKDLGQP